MKTPLTQPITGKFLEELIKKWVHLQTQTSTIDQAIKEAKEAGCHLIRPAALRDTHKKVNTLSMKCDDWELYHLVANFYHNHPALSYLPQATETPCTEVIKEDYRTALTSIHKEQELKKAGQSISTSTGRASVGGSSEKVFCFTFPASLREPILIPACSLFPQSIPAELSELAEDEEKEASKEEALTQSQELFGSGASQIQIPTPFTPAPAPTKTVTPITKSTSTHLLCMANLLTHKNLTSHSLQAQGHRS